MIDVAPLESFHFPKHGSTLHSIRSNRTLLPQQAISEFARRTLKQMFLDLWELAMKGRMTAWLPSAGSGRGKMERGNFWSQSTEKQHNQEK
jgi:hypothetical protein